MASENAKHATKLVALPRTGGKARTLLRVPKAGLTFAESTLAISGNGSR